MSAYPDAVAARMVAAAHRTRAEVEAEAAERARRRLLRLPADPFPAPGEDDLVRVLERGGSAFYCPDELALRMEMAAEMLEASAPEALYAAAVPAAARAMNRGRALVALEDEWGLSPDAGTHRLQTRTSLWGVPHAWLAAFDPEEPARRLVDGEDVAYRRTPVAEAVERVGHAAAVLAGAAPDAELLGELAVMIPWLQAFHPDAVLELDYGRALTSLVWPDDSVFDLWTLLDALEEGDEVGAGMAQERLNRRWARVGMHAHDG
nr:hypothetical protein [Micrococcus sp. ACRRV]